MAAILKQTAKLTLASGGTAQALSATDVIAESIIFSAPAGNSGVIYIGDADVSSTQAALILKAGDTVVLEAPRISGGNDMINLNLVYWDGTTSDELFVGYLQRTN